MKTNMFPLKTAAEQHLQSRATVTGSSPAPTGCVPSRQLNPPVFVVDGDGATPRTSAAAVGVPHFLKLWAGAGHSHPKPADVWREWGRFS